MTIQLWILIAVIVLTCHLWHIYEVKRHREAVDLVKRMRDWLGNDWMPPQGGEDE